MGGAANKVQGNITSGKKFMGKKVRKKNSVMHKHVKILTLYPGTFKDNICQLKELTTI